MNIYLLVIVNSGGYDSYSGHIVAAADEETARHLVPCGYECHSDQKYDAEHYDCIWHSPEGATCELIGRAAEDIKEGCILSNFHAG